MAFAGYGVPLQGDMSAGKMIFGVEGVDPDRRAKLVGMLDIDLYQRVNTMSDGQRRRVQICMGLLKPYDVSDTLVAALVICIACMLDAACPWMLASAAEKQGALMSSRRWVISPSCTTGHRAACRTATEMCIIACRLRLYVSCCLKKRVSIPECATHHVLRSFPRRCCLWTR